MSMSPASATLARSVSLRPAMSRHSGASRTSEVSRHTQGDLGIPERLLGRRMPCGTRRRVLAGAEVSPEARTHQKGRMMEFVVLTLSWVIPIAIISYLVRLAQ